LGKRSACGGRTPGSWRIRRALRKIGILVVIAAAFGSAWVFIERTGSWPITIEFPVDAAAFGDRPTV